MFSVYFKHGRLLKGTNQIHINIFDKRLLESTGKGV
jgi:hypothetical protein